MHGPGGQVVELAAGCEGAFKVGDKVMALLGGGTALCPTAYIVMAYIAMAPLNGGIALCPTAYTVLAIQLWHSSVAP